MRQFNASEIASLDRRFRANLINSMTGVKPANLVGTSDGDSRANLAIFSSAVHIGADPPLIGLLFRPLGDVERHTYDNIRETGHWTINHVPSTMTDRAHLTSAKFPKDASEFAACGFTEELIDGFPAPFVAECKLKLGLQLVQEIPMELNGTTLLIGRVSVVIAPAECIRESGDVDLHAAGSAGVAGLYTYHSLSPGTTYPYATPDQALKFGR